MPERGSDKHGPHVDEQMAHEVSGMVSAGRSTHAEEFKEPEPAGEDQPDPDRAADEELTGGTPPGMSSQDVAGRSELARHLQHGLFPATGDQIREQLVTTNAPDRLRSLVAGLPGERVYANVQEIWADLGRGTEQQRF